MIQTFPVRYGSVQTCPTGVYLDYQATTPMDPRVLDEMLPFEREYYGNPHSITHEFGGYADTKVEEARNHIANLINAQSKEIIFTSGATESNNLAIKGFGKHHGLPKGKNHIITTQIEHKCVLESCKYMEKNFGYEVTYLPVQSNGIIDLELLENSITDQTGLVSVMFVNNEIGVIQPIPEIGRICSEKGVLFHTDAAQALGKVPIDVEAYGIDMMSLSGHKIYGPKGIGGLFVRKTKTDFSSLKPRIILEPIISGGGQERGLRSGTLAPFLCVGFGEACRLASLEMDQDIEHISQLFDFFYNEIMDSMDYVYLNGDLEQRYKGNLNLSFAFIEGEALMLAIPDVFVSSGSACTSASLEPSYVLQALNVDDHLAHTSIRFGMGRFTTEEEIRYVVDRLKEVVPKLRDLSPLYDMAKKGIDFNSIQWDDSHHH